MKEKYNKKTDTRENIKGKRLHSDISGIQGMSIRGFKYFLVVVDDASRMYWVSLLKTKETNEVLNILKQIIASVELQSGNKLCYMRADNGKSEFGPAFTDFLKERGTQFEPCPPYKHSMNGVAERAIGLLSTYARSMLFEAQLPHQFWDYAIEHAAWIRNRVPTSALPFGPVHSSTGKWNIPHAAWYERPPKLDNLRPFGCVATLVYPKALMPQKWTPKTREGTSIFIGMRGESIHKMLFIATLQLWESADAKVDEYTYATVSLSHGKANVPTQQAPGSTCEYLPKPIVGRPKGVRQRRVEFASEGVMTEESRIQDNASWNTRYTPQHIGTLNRESAETSEETLTRPRYLHQSTKNLVSQDARNAPGELELSSTLAKDAHSVSRGMVTPRDMGIS
ncbi:hypothetical protein K3495_g15747, partial [Podosphaera aphanis]